MPNTSNPFAHRTNPNGTVDSICKTCFATVGTKEEVLDLKALEDSHVCEPWKVELIEAVLKNPKFTRK
jgi:hypothetical protein